MAAAKSISVIIPTFNRGRYLELTLESYTRQTLRDCEIIVVDDNSTDDTQGICERYARRLNLRVLRQNYRGRAEARNRGARAADGELLVMAEENRIVPAGFLEVLACTAEGEVVVPWRHGIISVWNPNLPASTTARVLNLMRRRRELGETLGTEDRALFDVKDLADRFDEILDTHRVEDYLWEQLQPIPAHFSDELSRFHLPWLLGLAGTICVARRPLFELGLYEEHGRGWDLEDPDLAYRLHRHGLRFRVSREAQSYQQQIPFHSWPYCGLGNLERFAARHDPIDTWLLYRFLTQEDVRTLDGVLADRRPGSATERQLSRVCRELVAFLIKDLGVWWHLETART